MSISAGPVIPLSCTESIDNHSRYCNLICIIPMMIHIRVSILDWSYNQTEYSEDEIIETMNKSWFNTKWVTLQNTSQNQEWKGCAVSSWLTQENVYCPNFQNTSSAGNFGSQVWLPEGHFGQFRAIGPMELLRPAKDDLVKWRTSGNFHAEWHSITLDFSGTYIDSYNQHKEIIAISENMKLDSCTPFY